MMPSSTTAPIATSAGSSNNNNRRRPDGLSRGKGQLALSSLKPESTRAINFQHKSIRNFLHTRPPGGSEDTTALSSPPSTEAEAGEANTNIVLTEKGTELVKRRVRISFNKDETSNRSLDFVALAAAASVPPKRLSSPTITPSDLKQLLDQKVEQSRAHEKNPQREISFRWGSLQFQLNEEDELSVPKRYSELSDSQEGFMAMEEFLSTLGGIDEEATKEEEDIMSKTTNEEEKQEEAEMKKTTTATMAKDDTKDTSDSDDFHQSIIVKNDDHTQNNTVEVAPGIHLPLKTPLETWAAVEEGRVTVTTCNHCKVELTCSDDAHLVMCVDCWVFSPVDQTTTAFIEGDLTASQTLDYKNIEKGCVSVGIQTEEIFEWIAIQEASALLGG